MHPFKKSIYTIYLKDREKQRERERISSGSFSKCLQPAPAMPKPGVQKATQISHVGSRKWSTWERSSPRILGRWKESSQDYNPPIQTWDADSNGQFNHCAKYPPWETISLIWKNCKISHERFLLIIYWNSILNYIGLN